MIDCACTAADTEKKCLMSWALPLKIMYFDFEEGMQGDKGQNGKQVKNCTVLVLQAIIIKKW